jgi:serine/threonine protein kinase
VSNSSGDATKQSGPVTKGAFSPGDVVAGRYRVVRLIGSGGSGDVYEAVDTSLGVAVALKTLKTNLARSAVQLERFRREIQNARKVTHLNVCRLFDMGVQTSRGRERFFLTMELLAGKSLAQRLEDGPPYEARDALPIAAQIVDGLQAAHDAGVVHRDLKPGNIMLLAPASGRPGPRAVITDFGIALSDEQGDIRLTQSGELVGTPEYMAPEQGDLGPALPASDIYAVGLILYEMLTKRRPFESAATPIGTLLQRQREAPRPLRDLLPGVDPVWEATILRCLEREPSRRFSRAADVGGALRGELPPGATGVGARKSSGKAR